MELWEPGRVYWVRSDAKNILHGLGRGVHILFVSAFLCQSPWWVYLGKQKILKKRKNISWERLILRVKGIKYYSVFNFGVFS